MRVRARAWGVRTQAQTITTHLGLQYRELAQGDRMSEHAGRGFISGPLSAEMTAALTDIQWAQLQEAWRVVDSDADGLVTCGMLSGSAWDAEAARTQRARAGRQTDSLPPSLSLHVSCTLQETSSSCFRHMVSITPVLINSTRARHMLYDMNMYTYIYMSAQVRGIQKKYQ